MNWPTVLEFLTRCWRSNTVKILLCFAGYKLFDGVLSRNEIELIGADVRDLVDGVFIAATFYARARRLPTTTISQ
jgi:hypothetical protein